MPWGELREAVFEALSQLIWIMDSPPLFDNSEVFSSGPDDMVRKTELALAHRVAADRVHRDPLSTGSVASGGPGLSR
jgi:hypothetical protein